MRKLIKYEGFRGRPGWHYEDCVFLNKDQSCECPMDLMPTLHKLPDDYYTIKRIDCKGVGDNNGFYEISFPSKSKPKPNAILKTDGKIEFSWIEEWQKMFLNAGTMTGYGDLSGMIPIVSSIMSAERQNILEILLKRFDYLESVDPDKSTDNWKNYKFIRNNIRDLLKTL
ncbi:MAG: hypothetical protein V4509_00595 [Patescibacteria group bacterium]